MTGPRAVRRSLHEDPASESVVAAAIADFRAEEGAPAPAELVVVIAALDEEASIAGVLQEIPATVAGLATRVLVVDDGSTDATGKIAAEYGALVCRLAVNCGHGTALRAGYRLARESGARYVATLDADGQWDPRDLPAMVELLAADRADFVVGSRQLGRTDNTDGVRNLGVRIFSALIGLITRTRITDSSSGLRAMRVEVTATVRQTQPQYQTSELLIGALLQGLPRPRSAHRHAGTTGGREQEGLERLLRTAVRAGHRRDDASRMADPGPAPSPLTSHGPPRGANSRSNSTNFATKITP